MAKPYAMTEKIRNVRTVQGEGDGNAANLLI